MNIKLYFINIQLELLRRVLHFLLIFKSPTNKVVIYCSQQLDNIIVKYYKVKSPSDKSDVHSNIALFSNTLNWFSKAQISQISSNDKALNLHIGANTNQTLPVNSGMSTVALTFSSVDV